MRHRFATRVRLHHHDSAPAYLPLALFRGIAGIAFLCFGELFWMHLSRIGLKDEAQVLGSIPLILGSVMAVGALCGAAGHSVRLNAAPTVVDGLFLGLKTHTPGTLETTPRSERVEGL